MGGNNFLLVRDLQLIEHLGGVAHRLPVGFAAHDDADQRAHRVILREAL